MLRPSQHYYANLTFWLKDGNREGAVVMPLWYTLNLTAAVFKADRDNNDVRDGVLQ
jgi:hypothetical protein